jgi:hypothetical protein
MLYKEKCGSLVEPPQVRCKLEFVREFPRYLARIASGTLPTRGTWADIGEDTPTRNIAVYDTEGGMDQYAPVRPWLPSAPDPLLEARHPPVLLLRELDVPASGVREIPQTMLETFREARVAECVQNYGRLDPGQENALVPVAVREEAVVICIASLLRAEKYLRAEVREMRAALDTVHERIVDSDERAPKAGELGDLLARAYSVLDKDSQARKRTRLD